jgi:hypothetical protein
MRKADGLAHTVSLLNSILSTHFSPASGVLPRDFFSCRFIKKSRLPWPVVNGAFVLGFLPLFLPD